MWADLDERTYRALPRMSGTACARWARSIAHGQHPDDGDSRSRAFGRLYHATTLEPEAAAARYRIGEWPARRGAAGEAAYAALAAELEAAGQELASPKDWARALWIAEAVHADPLAGALLRACPERERILLWDAPVPSKGKLDAFGSWDGRPAVIDLKGVGDARPGPFARDCASHRWHVQAAHYLRGLAAHGVEADWYWIAVETESPHGVTVYHAPADVILAGSDACEVAYAHWQIASEGVSAGYVPEIRELRLPRWALGVEDVD